MIKNAMRNIFRYKGQTLLAGVIALLAAAVSCIALTMNESTAKAEQMLSGSGRNLQGFSPYGNIGNTALIILIIALLVGGIALVVLGIYKVHKRQNEIGTLTAMGMKKGQIALQFAMEMFVVTIACALIGTGVGAAVSGPASRALIQMDSGRTRQTQNFGNWQQQNGNQQGGNQTNGNRKNGNQANGNQTDGNQQGGNQAYSQSDNQSNNMPINGIQANVKQTANNQAGSNQNSGTRSNRNANGNGSNQTNGNQNSNNQAGGNQNDNNQTNGNFGSNFGQGQRGGMVGRNRSVSPDIFVILETIGIGLGLAVLSACAAAVSVSGHDPMKTINLKKE